MIDDTLLHLLCRAAHLAGRQRRVQDARYLFERLAILYPDRAFPYVGVGLVRFEQRAFRDAAHWFRCAIDKVPDHAEALALLGMSQIEDGLHAAGVRALERALASGNDSMVEMIHAYLARPVCVPHRNRSIPQPHAPVSLQPTERVRHP